MLVTTSMPFGFVLIKQIKKDWRMYIDKLMMWIQVGQKYKWFLIRIYALNRNRPNSLDATWPE